MFVCVSFLLEASDCGISLKDCYFFSSFPIFFFVTSFYFLTSSAQVKQTESFQELPADLLEELSKYRNVSDSAKQKGEGKSE